jgi:hypothetical protein
MRERRKSKVKISGSGVTVLEKWPYYDVMNFLEYYLQHRTTTGNVPETATTTEMFQRQQLQLKCSRDRSYN